MTDILDKRVPTLYESRLAGRDWPAYTSALVESRRETDSLRREWWIDVAQSYIDLAREARSPEETADLLRGCQSAIAQSRLYRQDPA